MTLPHLVWLFFLPIFFFKENKCDKCDKKHAFCENGICKCKPPYTGDGITCKEPEKPKSRKWINGRKLFYIINDIQWVLTNCWITSSFLHSRHIYPPPLRAPTPNSLPPKLTRVFLQLQTTLIRWWGIYGNKPNSHRNLNRLVYSYSLL